MDRLGLCHPPPRLVVGRASCNPQDFRWKGLWVALFWRTCANTRASSIISCGKVSVWIVVFCRSPPPPQGKHSLLLGPWVGGTSTDLLTG